MSRLLPEKVKIGLFPGCCWLQRRGVAELVIVRPEGQGAEALTAAFIALLAKLPEAGRARIHLHVLVSDSLAAITLLPWQESLVADDELRAYAQACFEQAGNTIDASWAMQYHFRQFRAPGMAYALSHVWLSQLVALSETAGMHLKTVLPLSASAYQRQGGARTEKQSVLLLVEQERLTALICVNGMLINRDVQPVMGKLDAAGVRLLMRVTANQRNVQAVYYCDPSYSEAVSPQAFVAACLPQSSITPVIALDWI
ncbi:hypothetical protein GTP55_13590 [Duganella sp. FT109W]|uniref:DUF3037 domain-containing protein n=1 Tax=Duganella margarita TaxID=2692170 RepID=A0ABW9WGZ1_9BURK|nr:hypothetical protein [Duganella margarita]MYN40407.1 hypothetical protein [Duganella margarita]